MMTEEGLSERIKWGNLLLSAREKHRGSLEEQTVWLAKLMGSEAEARAIRPSLFDELDAENDRIQAINDKMHELAQQLAELKK